MLHTTCPRTAAALAQVATISYRARTWGRFAQRTIDRRYCGILATAFIASPATLWFPVAVRAAGGRPSAHCWQPFQVAAPAPSPSGFCHFCTGPIDAASRCACFGSAHV